MNPIAVTTIYGFVKGAALPGPKLEASLEHLLYVGLRAPLAEEAKYRDGDKTLLDWAYDHTAPVRQQTGNFSNSSVLQMADVLFAGVMYGLAYMKYGLKGAVVAHGLHNVAAIVGNNVTADLWKRS